MKKLISYLTACIFLVACTADEKDTTDRNIGNTTGDNANLRISVSVPGYRVPTRGSGVINNLRLLTFDKNGLLTGIAEAVLRDNPGNGTQDFTAEVFSDTKYIHFLGNYEKWDEFDESAQLGKDEREIIPRFYDDTVIYWAREEVDFSASANVNVSMYRNEAKVSVTKDPAVTDFTLEGFELCNYAGIGTAAPFFPNAEPSPFIISDSETTLPVEPLDKIDCSGTSCGMNDKYMFEDENYYNDQCYVIVKGRSRLGSSKYYKIQLLDEDKEPYKIIRNCHYKVIIKSFAGDTGGSLTFEDAKNAEASNNVYAEILKEALSVSDATGNTLSVNRVNFCFPNAGRLNINAIYTLADGTAANSQISATIIEDKDHILSGLTNNGNGNISADVKGVTAGQSEAAILIKAGKLSRLVTVVSSELYSFEPASLTPGFYTHKDQPLALSFTIPVNVSEALFPLDIHIVTNNIYPTEPNKDLEIEYMEGGKFMYIYTAYGPGEVNLNFKTSLENSDETIYLESEYFETEGLNLISRYFDNVSINSDNLVAYSNGAAARLTFSVEGLTELPVNYPLTVHIKTNNLTTADSGWTADPDNGGYSRTFASNPGTVTVDFSSKSAISYETIELSAPGVRVKTLPFDNYLTTDLTRNGNITYGSGRYSLININVTSYLTSVVPNFRSSSIGRYGITIKQNARLSDKITFFCTRTPFTVTYYYYSAYTVEELLASPEINMKLA